ncbi:MAG TPA: hypothetical protein VNC16_04910 [Solirubrobacterales bacterium]|jgi:hypothetical protein|nr:hypothetical protein [Solirubrobacterales bacterium]
MGEGCSICGRTILAGERVHGFFEGRDQRSVCELCVARAEGLGWRAGSEPEPESKGHSHEGRLRRLFHRRDRRPGAPAPTPSTAPRRRPLPPVDELGFTPFERAVARFNSSEAGRAVAGLTRTLGAPRASVGSSAGAPEEVRITVAWELSWYQWSVDIADELSPVAELGKGGEVEQLDAAARQWNARVEQDGQLRLVGERAPSR